MGYIPRRFIGPSRTSHGCTQELMALQMALPCPFCLARCRLWWRWWLQEDSGTTRSLHDISENKLSLEICLIWRFYRQVYPYSTIAGYSPRRIRLSPGRTSPFAGNRYHPSLKNPQSSAEMPPLGRYQSLELHNSNYALSLHDLTDILSEPPWWKILATQKMLKFSKGAPFGSCHVLF